MRLVAALWPPKPALVIAVFLALCAVPEQDRRLAPYRLWDIASAWQVLEFTPRGLPQAEMHAVAAGEGVHGAGRGPVRIADAARNLDPFYRALLACERGAPRAQVRVLHYGDSPTTADLITADLRDMLQRRFGDAGHGFILIAQPWAWYQHRGFRLFSGGWTVDPAVQSSLRDGLYGIGGVSFRGSDGTWSIIQLPPSAGDVAEIAYLRQPAGGIFRVSSNGLTLAEVETGGSVAPRFHSVRLPAGARRLELSVSSGAVRLFGIYFRKDTPGVIYSSLGLNGAYVSILSRVFDEAHWKSQLQHYDPHLVVISYGTNESVYEQFVTRQYAREMREILRRIRAALPGVSILIMSPMDRATRTIGGEVQSAPAISKLVEIQRRLAAEENCAFYNTYEAAGGPGTAERWYNSKPRLIYADFIHPSPAGAKMVAGLLFEALLDGYNKYKLRRMQDGLQLYQ